MTIQPINDTSMVLFLSPEDLRRRGMCAGELTRAQTGKLAREALGRADLDWAEPLELEVYPDACGVLVFVSVRHPRRTVWYFTDSEPLLQGVAALDAGQTDGVLYGVAEGYVLVVSGRAACLAEFGRQEPEDGYICQCLQEQGTVLLSHDAPALLRQYFRL